MGLRTLHQRRAIVWTGGALLILATVTFLIRLVALVNTGHGLDSYTSGRGVETNAIQVLATVGVFALIALVVGVITVVKRRGRKRLTE